MVYFVRGSLSVSVQAYRPPAVSMTHVEKSQPDTPDGTQLGRCMGPVWDSRRLPAGCCQWGPSGIPLG